jgi:predicted choloylglycine hydrolase
MPPEVVEFARECRKQLERWHPGLVEEIDGYGEGLCCSPDDLLWHFTLGVSPGATRHCSSVGFYTENGPAVGRNYDFFYFVNMRHLVTTRADGALAHMGMWEGCAGGRMDGINADGLWVSVHFGGCRQPKCLKPGLGFHHVARMLLEKCSTVPEAVAVLAEVPHIAPYSYFLADPREMCVVEASPERQRVRRPKDGVLACTNHPVHPEMVDLESTDIRTNSCRRLARLHAGAKMALANEHPMEVLEDTMRDHMAPVCGHRDGLATLWSAICVPGLRHIAYCFGAPCRNPYTPSPWPE